MGTNCWSNSDLDKIKDILIGWDWSGIEEHLFILERTFQQSIAEFHWINFNKIVNEIFNNN